MVQEHKRLSEIAGFFGKSSASVKMKISRLKLVVVVRQIQHTTTSNELPSVEDALKDLVEVKTSLSVIAKKLGVSEESARAKIRRLGLEEVEQRKNACSSSSELIMPEELISIEDALKKLVVSMTALETIGLGLEWKEEERATP